MNKAIMIAPIRSACLLGAALQLVIDRLGKSEVAVLLEGDDGRPLVRVYRIEHR